MSKTKHSVFNSGFPPLSQQNLRSIPTKIAFKQDIRKIAPNQMKILNNVKPNFDWWGAIKDAAMDFIPGAKTIGHVIDLVKEGHKSIKKHFHDLNEGRKPKVKHERVKEIHKVHNTKEIKPYGYNLMREEHKKLLTHSTKEIKKAIHSMSLNSHTNSVNAPPYLSKEFKKEEKSNTFSPSRIQKFKESCIISVVPGANYSMGQVIVQFPLYATLFGKDFELAAQQFSNFEGSITVPFVSTLCLGIIILAPFVFIK